jgi:transposase
METIYFLGIDISKKKFDAALTINGKDFSEAQVNNNPAAIKVFFEELKRQINLSQLVVCLEHTGIYLQCVLDFLIKNKIKVCVESALQIKQSQGLTRGKSDKIDARRIALYAFKNLAQLTFWVPQRRVIQELKALLVVRDRLIKAKNQLQVPLNESHEFIEAAIQKECIKHSAKGIAALQTSIEQIHKAIMEIIRKDQRVAEQYKLVESVTGIGDITAANMIVSTGEFERIQDPKKLACHAGVAPFEHSSGSSIRGKTRVSKKANMTLKKLLHLAAMSAIQADPDLKAFYHRKIASGKNKMSVLNAVRNKLISRVFACIKNKRMYLKNYQHALA